MGTNYYVRSTTGDAEPLHVGKRSAGWTFGFQTYPRLGIYCRADWERVVAEVGEVRDEYNAPLTPEEFWKLVDDTRKPWNGRQPHTRERLETRVGNLVFTDEKAYVDHDGWDCTMSEFS